VSTARPDLDALVGKWQGILRLKDWDVSCCYKRYHEMPLEKSVGCCSVSIERNSAEICILDPLDMEPDASENTRSIEASVVHELLHIWQEPYRPQDKDSLAYKYWERTTDSLSVVLLALERMGHNKKRKR
jgi:hypothetical protein